MTSFALPSAPHSQECCARETQLQRKKWSFTLQHVFSAIENDEHFQMIGCQGVMTSFALLGASVCLVPMRLKHHLNKEEHKRCCTTWCPTLATALQLRQSDSLVQQMLSNETTLLWWRQTSPCHCLTHSAM